MRHRKQQEPRTPPDGDPSWPGRCRPLILHLREGPRSNEELAVWRRGQGIGPGMMVQMLAWACNRKFISYRNRRWQLGWSRTPAETDDTSE